MKKFNKKFYPFIAGITLIALTIIIALSFTFNTTKHSQEENSASNQVWVKDHSPMMGPVNAPITLVEFFDPACEGCRAWYPHIKQIMQQYPQELRLVIRYVDFHKQSAQAIGILEASRKQNQFQNTLETLLAFQPAWAPHGKPGIDPWSLIDETTMNIQQAKKDAQSSQIDKIIELDMTDVKAAEVKRTPTFFINGKPLKLMHPDSLKEMIEAELKLLKKEATTQS